MDILAFIDSDRFQDYKILIESYTGLARDALHIHIGLLIFVIIRLCWRRKGGWILAWLGALAAALGGEWLDLRREILHGDVQSNAAHWHDIWNTMLWPTILLFVGQWLQPGRKEKAPEEPASGDLVDDALDKPGEEPPSV